MNRKMLLGAALWGLGMGIGFSSTARAADVPGVDQETQNTQFVEMTYLSLCQRKADPATLSYYLNALDEKSRTYAEVHADIDTTCMHHSQADACRHVTGLSDVCPPPEN